MLVRDDASSDATVSIIRRLAAEDRRIVLLEDASARYRPAKNYGSLLQWARQSGAEYVFLADQDDIWLAGKISQQIDLMRCTEAAAGRETPILSYSDLMVVDGRLRMIHPSFFRYAHLHCGTRYPLRTLLAHNFIPGCVMLLNRPLLELVLPLPSASPMHDWWIALCAAAAGRLAFLPEQTVLYRQHGSNVVGARGSWVGFNPTQPGWKKRWDRGMADFARHIQQTHTLRCRLYDRGLPCPQEMRALLDRYCQLVEAPNRVWGRMVGLHRLGIPKTTLLRRLLFYARILNTRKSGATDS
jgi:glycosyltransferase involved in cell wall biosynthesis